MNTDRQVAELIEELDAAELKAWDALGRYKFWMFGYWAAIWVHLNRIGGFRRPNPWRKVVMLARAEKPLISRKRPAPLLDREPAGHG